MAGEAFTSHTEDVVSSRHRSNPAMTEIEKVSHLMTGVVDDALGCPAAKKWSSVKEFTEVS